MAEVLALPFVGMSRVEIEIKTDPRLRRPAPKTLVETVVEVVRRCGCTPYVGLRAFDWRALRYAARICPELPLTWLSDAETLADPKSWGLGPIPPPDCVPKGATWAPDHRNLTQAQVERAHAAGISVIPWTVNARPDMVRLLAWGVDGLCTDDIVLALSAIR